MSSITVVILVAVAIIIGFGLGFGLFRYVLTSMLNNKMDEAQKEAEVLKEKKTAWGKREIPQQEGWTRKRSTAAQLTHRAAGEQAQAARNGH